MEQKQVTTLNDVLSKIPVYVTPNDFKILGDAIVQFAHSERMQVLKDLSEYKPQIPVSPTDTPDCDMCESAPIDINIIDQVKAEL